MGSFRRRPVQTGLVRRADSATAGSNVVMARLTVSAPRGREISRAGAATASAGWPASWPPAGLEPAGGERAVLSVGDFPRTARDDHRVLNWVICV